MQCNVMLENLGLEEIWANIGNKVPAPSRSLIEELSTMWVLNSWSQNLPKKAGGTGANDYLNVGGEESSSLSFIHFPSLSLKYFLPLLLPPPIFIFWQSGSYSSLSVGGKARICFLLLPLRRSLHNTDDSKSRKTLTSIIFGLHD